MVARESWSARQENMEARRSTILGGAALFRGGRQYDRPLRVRQSFRWWALSNPWPLRDGAAPLSLDRRERRRRRAGVGLCRSWRSGAQNSYRLRNPDRIRAYEHLSAQRD